MKRIKGTMTMVCTCGFNFNLACKHEWVTQKVSDTSINIMGGTLTQERRLYFCCNCGAVQNTNTTTGETTITNRL